MARHALGWLLFALLVSCKAGPHEHCSLSDDCASGLACLEARDRTLRCQDAMAVEQRKAEEKARAEREAKAREHDRLRRFKETVDQADTPERREELRRKLRELEKAEKAASGD